MNNMKPTFGNRQKALRKYAGRVWGTANAWINHLGFRFMQDANAAPTSPMGERR
jgi:hypothetical protein